MKQSSSRRRVVIPCSPKQVARTMGAAAGSRLDAAFRQRITYLKTRR